MLKCGDVSKDYFVTTHYVSLELIEFDYKDQRRNHLFIIPGFTKYFISKK